MLRSKKGRTVLGADTGTATEIVLALTDRSLTVYGMDLADESIEEQIMLFESATFAVGMHTAWSRASAIIEVATSCGWARYVDGQGKCATNQDLSDYIKGGYYLARRFCIHHGLSIRCSMSHALRIAWQIQSTSQSFMSTPMRLPQWPNKLSKHSIGTASPRIPELPGAADGFLSLISSFFINLWKR